MVSQTHNFSLMLVAIVVSVVAAFTGLALTRKIGTLPDWTRKALVAMSSLVIGGGIWTMHFVAMLANEFSVPVGYDVVHTLISGLVSILVVGVALLLLHYTPRTSRVLNLAGMILGAGIVSMHYIGMSAMRGAVPGYSSHSIILALLAAAVFCLCAVRVAYGKRSKEHIVGGGLLLGLSVVVVHYTAMLGIRYEPAGGHDVGTIAMGNSTLAIVLVVAVFMICGAFLLVSATFLTSPEQTQGIGSLSTEPQRLSEIPANDGVQSNVVPEETVSQSPDDPVLSDVSSESLQTNTGEGAQALSTTQLRHEENSAPDLRIPYERNKRVSFVDHK